MSNNFKDSEFVKVGQLPILKAMVKEVVRITPTQDKFLDASVEIHENPDACELAYMARELVQCTLPHRDPGDIPVWKRNNGNITLVVARTSYDQKTKKLVGFPFGSIPRLLLFWMTTEAVQTGKRRLELGKTYAGFLRDIGLSPGTGGGKRSDAKRVQDQTRRLFGASISFQQTLENNSLIGERHLNMEVASQSEFWWDPKSPEQFGLWGSWVELGEKFFQAITAAPVPLDMRALRVLKRSPLALDLYVWATHKALSVSRKGKIQFVSWRNLMKQFGSDYNDPRNFQKNAIAKLKIIQSVYPNLKLVEEYGGISILPSSQPAIPPRISKKDGGK